MKKDAERKRPFAAIEGAILIAVLLALIGFAFYAPLVPLACGGAFIITFYLVITRDVIGAAKGVFYLTLYFLPIFFLQAITHRGEVIEVGTFSFDRYGVLFAFLYFIRLITFLFIIKSALHYAKMFAREGRFATIPLADAIARGVVFFRLVRKMFFREVRNAQEKGIYLRTLPATLARLIVGTHNRVFRLYPFTRFLRRRTTKR